MHLFVYSYFPPLSSHLAGGAQLVLRTLLQRLPDHGFTVSVACPATDEPLLELAPAVEVHAALEEPGRTPLTPAQRLHNLRVVARLARDCDAALTVDRAFPLSLRRPLVLLLNNFSYGTEVDSVFAFDWDTMIVPSDFVRAQVEAVAGPGFWVRGRRPIEVIEPALDGDHFRPVESSSLRRAFGLGVDDRVLLFPHRPDPGKGFETALRVISELRARGLSHRLLVPEAPLSTRAVRRREAAYVSSLRSRARALGDAVVFHPWLPYDDMPALFSLGSRTLALGGLPEAFGFTSLQSVACGTPVVATGAGARRNVLPPRHGLALARDGREASAVADLVLTPVDAEETRRGREFIRARYDPARFAERVAAHVVRARKSRARYVPVRTEARVAVGEA